MLGPFATASRRMPPVLILHCHSPGVATVARRHCRTLPVHRCPQRHRQQQRQRVTDGKAMAPYNGPNKWSLTSLVDNQSAFGRENNGMAELHTSDSKHPGQWLVQCHCVKIHTRQG